MRAAKYTAFAACNGLFNLPFFRRGGRARQHRAFVIGKIPLQKLAVLARQNLGRGKNNRLITRFDRHIYARERNCGLSAAHVALQKHIHFMRRMHAIENCADSRLLPLGKFELIAGYEGVNVLPRDRIRVKPRLLSPALNHLKGGNQQKILLYRNALGRLPYILAVLRAMQFIIRLRKRQKLILFLNWCGDMA